MSEVSQVIVNGVPVPGLFQKITTEGDIHRFVSAETGHAQIIHRDDPTVLTSGASRVEVHSGYLKFNLDFRYLVGVHQITAGIVDVTFGWVAPILDLLSIQSARNTWPATAVGDLDPSVASVRYFEEDTELAIRVYNTAATDKVFVFQVPHTATPATSRSKIIVDNQGDDVAIECLGEGDGFLLRSRNGSQWLVRIDDEGVLGVDAR